VTDSYLALVFLRKGQGGNQKSKTERLYQKGRIILTGR